MLQSTPSRNASTLWGKHSTHIISFGPHNTLGWQLRSTDKEILGQELNHRSRRGPVLYRESTSTSCGLRHHGHTHRGASLEHSATSLVQGTTASQVVTSFPFCSPITHSPCNGCNDILKHSPDHIPALVRTLQRPLNALRKTIHTLSLQPLLDLPAATSSNSHSFPALDGRRS